MRVVSSISQAGSLCHLLLDIHHHTTITRQDIDGDGDADIAVVERANVPQNPALLERHTMSKVIHYQNDGDSFSSTQLYEGSDVRVYLSSGDIDSDGDADLLQRTEASLFSAIQWYEDRVVGDGNGDGQFDSQDLVAIFESGEYEDEHPNNSTFDEGDWNGDGDFDSADLVLAFKTGTFVAATRPISNEMAAAIDHLFDDDRST